MSVLRVVCKDRIEVGRSIAKLILWNIKVLQEHCLGKYACGKEAGCKIDEIQKGGFQR